MMCVFCGNREKCWDKMPDDELEMQWVKCNYDDYVLAEEIDVEDLLEESERRMQAKDDIGNVG